MNKHQSRDIVFIDIESTDVDVHTASVIELGAVRYTPGGELLKTFSRKVIPKSVVSPYAAKINGYSELSWKGATHFSIALDTLNERMFNDFPNKTNAASYFMFDHDVIANQCKREGLEFPFSRVPWLDIAAMTYPLVLTGRVDSRRLVDLAEFLEVEKWHEHRAVEDAKALASCYFFYLKKLNRAILAGDVAKHTIDKVGAFLTKRLALVNNS